MTGSQGGRARTAAGRHAKGRPRVKAAKIARRARAAGVHSPYTHSQRPSPRPQQRPGDNRAAASTPGSQASGALADDIQSQPARRRGEGRGGEAMSNLAADGFYVASDVGGTFTDTVVSDTSGVLHRYKAASTPGNL